MWRLALANEDDTIVEMSLALYREDPAEKPIYAEQIHRTLVTLREETWRGRVVVLEVEGRIGGYSILVSFWSNELGGEVCVVDELYLRPELRSRGLGSTLFDELERGTIWPGKLAGTALE